MSNTAANASQDERREALVYLDYAATSPSFPEAIDAAADATRRWFGNPSGIHRAARQAKRALEGFREELRSLCNATSQRLILTSGATEGNNWVIRGVMEAKPNARIVVSVDSHTSMWNPAQRYAERVDVLPVDADGHIEPAGLAQLLRPETALVCVPHAANETGVIHDIAAMAAVCREAGVPLLVDGAQSLGHVPVSLAEIDCDFLVFSAHKFGGLRGTGGVFLSRRLRPPGCCGASPLPASFAALMSGGAQELGLRPGTENVAAVAAAATALRRSIAVLPTEQSRLRELAATAAKQIAAAVEDAVLNGCPSEGLPGLLSVSFADLNGRALVADLSRQGFAIASGSACSEQLPEPSRAILALGRSENVARGTVRLSFGRDTMPAEVADAVSALVQTVRRHRSGRRPC